jgi:hypothetical protein
VVRWVCCGAMPYKFRQSQVLAPSRKMVRRLPFGLLLLLPLRCCEQSRKATRTHPAPAIVVIRFRSSFARATGCATSLRTCPARAVACRSPSATARLCRSRLW